MIRTIQVKIMKQLDELKKKCPNQRIIVETPRGSVELKIGDALIYDDPSGAIVIDSE